MAPFKWQWAHNIRLATWSIRGAQNITACTRSLRNTDGPIVCIPWILIELSSSLSFCFLLGCWVDGQWCISRGMDERHEDLYFFPREAFVTYHEQVCQDSAKTKGTGIGNLTWYHIISHVFSSSFFKKKKKYTYSYIHTYYVSVYTYIWIQNNFCLEFGNNKLTDLPILNKNRQQH